MKKVVRAILALAMLMSVMAVMAFAEGEKVTVTFDENNGTEPYSIEVEKGEVLHELPMPDTDEDHVSTGWYCNKEATERFDITEPITENITIYAGWHAPMQFTDVKDTDEFYDAIRYVFYTDIMKGISDTAFGPDDSLTRAMLVTILYRYEGEPAFMNDLVFTDVERGSYYEKAVVWANGKGIVNGVSAEEFAPDKNITREQLAAILYRYAVYKEIPIEEASADTNTLSFDDIMDISEYARPAVHCCLATDVLLPRGMKIEPTADATRAETAQAIRAIGNIFVEAPLSYEELAGSYDDSVSQRAGLLAEAAEDGLGITVYWGNSASEAVKWTMKASYAEDGTLAYTDCKKSVLKMNEDGHETEDVVYENGTGYFSTFGGVLYWNGAADEECTLCVFEKFPVEDPTIIGMPNPMVEVTKEELEKQLGFSFGVPEGATDVCYYIIAGELGEMLFTLDGLEYTARIKPADAYEDISGLYFNWDVTDDCKIGGREGKSMRYIGGETELTEDLCLWYDAAPGLMYSLATHSSDLSGFDITAIAAKVFVPVQGEAK